MANDVADDSSDGQASGADVGPEAGASDNLIENMRGRMAKCRRLADGIFDEKARKALLQMASEIERDVLRLEAERDGHTDRPSLPSGSY